MENTRKYEIRVMPIDGRKKKPKIRVVVARYNGYEGLKETIGGYLEDLDMASLLPFLNNPNNRYCAFADEEGKLKNLQMSCLYFKKVLDETEQTYSLKPYDTINGVCVIRSFDGEESDQGMNAYEVAEICSNIRLIYEPNIELRFADMDIEIEVLQDLVEIAQTAQKLAKMKGLTDMFEEDIDVLQMFKEVLEDKRKETKAGTTVPPTVS